MKITLIYDNEVYEKKKDLTADWGFSCLVEVKDQPKILFDTGAKGGILLDNMKKLGIKPKSISEVFLSHDHWDHVDGLVDFLEVSGDVEIYCPASYQPPKTKDIIKNIIRIKEPTQIHEHIFSTGELGGAGNKLEQSLVVNTDKGLVVICGCSHPGVEAILQAASGFGSGKVYALIGGLHGFREFDLLGGLELICPCHCTQFKSEIKSLYPDKCVGGGAGRVIEI